VAVVAVVAAHVAVVAVVVVAAAHVAVVAVAIIIMNMFFKLLQLLPRLPLPSFACPPLRRSWAARRAKASGLAEARRSPCQCCQCCQWCNCRRRGVFALNAAAAAAVAAKPAG
jgi:hypothetical protein